MAFMNKDFSVIAYANGFTLWHYSTNDSIKDLENPDYFGVVYTLANPGDIMILNTAEGAFFRQIKHIEAHKIELAPLGE